MVTACSDNGRDEQYSQYIDYDSSPTTIVYMTIGDKPTNGKTEEIIEQLNEILIERLNARLDVYYIPWTDYLNKYNYVLNDENTKVDLVGTSTDWLDAWPNVTKGNFYPLTKEMLSTYCADTFACVSDEEWEACTYNDNIYLIPENEFSQWTNHGFIYRGDWAGQAGMEEGLHSWDDMTKYFEYVIENHPEVTPFSADTASVTTALGYISSTTDYVPIMDITSYELWGAYKDEPDKIVSPFYEGQELIDFAILMKTWKKMGVFENFYDVEDINTDITVKFYSGKSACIQHHTNMYIEDRKPNMDIAQPGSNAKFFWFGEENQNLVRTSILHGAMAVSADSQHPELALMVYDLIRNDEECYRLMNYGIEGVQYNIKEDNVYTRPSDYNTENDSFTLNYWWGRRDELELVNFGRDEAAYDLLKSYYEDCAIEYPWENIHFDTTDYSNTLSDIENVCNEYLPQICYGKYQGEPEEMVSRFRQALKDAGFEKLTEFIQKKADEKAK